MKNVAVFFGGNTVEHDISVITGVLTINSLDKVNYNVVPIFVDGEGKWRTGKNLNDIGEYEKLNVKKTAEVCLLCGDDTLYKITRKRLKPICKVDMAINCLHGERGEDGSLSGLLSMSGVAFISPDVLPSAICMDKCATKIFLRGLQIKTVEYVKILTNADVKKVDKLSFPVIVKPARSGSSFGISKVRDEDKLMDAIRLARKFDDKVIVERCVEGFYEINCAGYFDGERVVVSECEKAKGKEETLSFTDKYVVGERIFPAPIDKKISDSIKKIVEKIYSALDMRGIIRVDFIVKGDEIFVNEINTVPGSLAYYLFCKTNGEFSTLLSTLIKNAEKEFNDKKNLIKEYKSGILGGGSKSNIKCLKKS